MPGKLCKGIAGEEERPGRRLIFLDIDGTLTQPGENTPPESAVKAIRRAQKNGHRVFLCSGRNLGMLSPLLAYGFDGVIANAGGYVAIGNPTPERVLFDCPMTDAQRDIALEALHRNGVFCTIEAKDVTWGDEKLDAFLKGRPAGNSEIERWRRALSENLGIQPMREYDGRPIYKIVVMCGEMSQLDEARSLLENEFRFCMQHVPLHGCINGELINRRFDKGRGVTLVREYFGASPEDTIGFGDSMNDLEMLQTVGTSICMENGAAELKEIADRICGRVEDDGLAREFEALGLA